MAMSNDKVALSRRDVLIGGIGLSAGLTLPSLAFADQSSPRAGGDLRMGLNGASVTDSLDPASYTATYMQSVGLQIHNTLTEIDEKGTAQPVLAESWDAKPGAAEWTIKLRPGVQFHNGKTLTADDVVYSLNHHRKPDSKSGAKAYFSSVTDIAAKSPTEVSITLSSGNADIPYLLADYHLCIMPENGRPDAGVGTGAFVLESFNPGVQAVTKRNPNYWNSRRGHVDSVHTVAIDDPTARASALQSGEIDLMNRVDPRIVRLIQQNTNLQIYNTPGAGSYYFVMRCDVPPFDNNDLRLAMKYAIDREEIVKKILNGYGRIGNDNPIDSFDPFYAADIPQRPYDPDQAAFHFKKSGFSGPVQINVSDGAFTGAVDAALLLQASAAKGGITIDVVKEPADGYWDNVWMKKSFCASYSGGRVTPDLILSLNYKSDAPWNETFWKRADFDSLLIAARSELNFEKRKAMYHDLQVMLVDQGGALIPMFNNFLDASTAKLDGFVPSAYIELGGGRAAERVWFKA